MDINLIEEQKNRVAIAERELPSIKISNRYAGLKVLGLVADNSACGYYRVYNPLKLLEMHGADVQASSHHGLDAFLKYDVIVAPRQHSPEVYEILRFAAWEDKLVVYEIDDDLDSVLPSSPAYYTYHPGSPELAMIGKFIKYAHGLTTTTPEIARWYYQYNRNVSVIENYIDFSLRDWGSVVKWEDGGIPIIQPLPIQKPKEWEGYTVIGWQGGTTHQEDLMIVGPQVKRILEKHPKTLFAMYSSVEMAQKFADDYNLPKDRVMHIPARHFLDHPSGMHGVDIQLAPILCCQFNLAKSHLKCLEGMAVGSAVIASNVGPYARFERRHPGSILTVGKGNWSKGTWFEAMDYLVTNPDKMKEMQIAGRQLILEQYSLEKNFHLWPMAWKAINNKIEDGECGPPDINKPRDWFKSYAKAGRNDPCPCGSGLKYKNCCNEAWG